MAGQPGTKKFIHAMRARRHLRHDSAHFGPRAAVTLQRSFCFPGHEPFDGFRTVHIANHCGTGTHARPSFALRANPATQKQQHPTMFCASASPRFGNRPLCLQFFPITAAAAPMRALSLTHRARSHSSGSPRIRSPCTRWTIGGGRAKMNRARRDLARPASARSCCGPRIRQCLPFGDARLDEARGFVITGLLHVWWVLR